MSQINQIHHSKIPVAQIRFGPDEAVLSDVIQLLQRMIPHDHIDADCYTCNAIRMHEHASVYWLNPEKNYVLEELEELFRMCAFKRDALDPLFILFQKAETLNMQCSNSLLKLVEEPPVGYHFIFLTNKLEAIVPTIRSRCHIHTLSAETDTAYLAKLIDILLEQKSSALGFAKELDALKIDEVESLKLLDELITVCAQKTKSALENDDNRAYVQWTNIHAVALENLKRPPMAGSSKLFWRNLYLQLHV